jgi:hypothetical protein
MANALSNQINNRNFLSPVGFKFTLARFPKVSFFSNSAKIPEITLQTIQQPTYLKTIDIPGDELTFGDFTLRFLVDEGLENYMTVHNWLYGLGAPESLSQYAELIDGDNRDEKKAFSDGTLRILNSNYRDVALVKFKDLFPVSLNSLDFEAQETDIRYFTADVTFKYTVYTITNANNEKYEP